MRRWIERTSDEALVTRAQLGDVEAFDELARRYRPAMTVTADGVLHDRDRASDVVQNALLDAYRDLPSLERRASFGAWLRTTTLRQAYHALRADKARWRDADHLDTALTLACPGLQPAADAERREPGRLVHVALGRISASDADLVRMRYLEDVPVDRIAAYLGLSRDGAKYRLKRATAHLRSALRLLLEGDPNDERVDPQPERGRRRTAAFA